MKTKILQRIQTEITEKKIKKQRIQTEITQIKMKKIQKQRIQTQITHIKMKKKIHHMSHKEVNIGQMQS